MGFFANTFDTIRVANKLHKTPHYEEPERDIYNEHDTRLKDLPLCFHKMYFDLLKHDSINIREVDFGDFEQNDLDYFYNFLESKNHGIFEFSGAMQSFKPAATSKPIFI